MGSNDKQGPDNKENAEIPPKPETQPIDQSKILSMTKSFQDISYQIYSQPTYDPKTSKLYVPGLESVNVISTHNQEVPIYEKNVDNIKNIVTPNNPLPMFLHFEKPHETLKLSNSGLTVEVIGTQEKYVMLPTNLTFSS